MSDSYQAIYDAVRSRISNGNIGDAVSEAARQAFDISWPVAQIRDLFQGALSSYDRASAVFRPRLFLDGNKYCALYGENLMDGCAGFGDTPDAAMWDFDKNWSQMKVPTQRIPASKLMDLHDQTIDNLKNA